MLFKQAVLEGIAAGRITQAFRRWRRPTVKQGGTLRTSAGVLAILKVEQCSAADLKTADARKSGFATLDELLRDIEAQRAGTLYRVRFRLAGADPRIALRKQGKLSDTDRSEIADRLKRLDKASRSGPWTMQALRQIQSKPATRALELAQALGMERLAFKRNVRKLKELGLTESLGTGYRLSARGRSYMARAS